METWFLLYGNIGYQLLSGGPDGGLKKHYEEIYNKIRKKDQ
jgi:hypothetical protein